MMCVNPFGMRSCPVATAFWRMKNPLTNAKNPTSFKKIKMLVKICFACAPTLDEEGAKYDPGPWEPYMEAVKTSKDAPMLIMNAEITIVRIGLDNGIWPFDFEWSMKRKIPLIAKYNPATYEIALSKSISGSTLDVKLFNIDSILTPWALAKELNNNIIVPNPYLFILISLFMILNIA